MNRIFLLIPLLFAPASVLAQHSTQAPLKNNASLADTLTYLQDVLNNREDIFYVTQSPTPDDPADPHFVSWDGDSLSRVHVDGYVLEYDQARKFENAQGPDVSFTPRYASHLPDNVIPRTASEDRFQIDLRDVQSVQVEDLETYLRRTAEEHSYNSHVQILPPIFAVTVFSGDHPFSFTRLYPRYGLPSHHGPMGPTPHRPGRWSSQTYTGDDDTGAVIYTFKTESAAKDFAAALKHASSLARIEADQAKPQP